MTLYGYLPLVAYITVSKSFGILLRGTVGKWRIFGDRGYSQILGPERRPYSRPTSTWMGNPRKPFPGFG